MLYKKYYVYKQQYSEDGGRTWKDTDPLITTPSGDSIGEYATLEECQGTSPTPTGCTAFIVDGGTWDNVAASGETACDSAFLYIDGTPQFTPQSASTWVDITFSYWDKDPHDTSHFCSLYNESPCVANDLMRDARIVDNNIQCSDIPTPTMADMPQIVQDTITGSTPYTHALGTIRYTVKPNIATQPRSCTIRWIVDSDECPSKDFTISQLPAEVVPTCDCSTFSAMTSGVEVPATKDGVEYNVGKYTAATDCTSDIVISSVSGTSFLSSFRFDGGNIYAKVDAENFTESTISTKYYVKQGDCEDYFTVTQEAGVTPTANVFKWADQGHPTAYTATTNGEDSALRITNFHSIYNGTYPNAVLSANVDWIITQDDVFYVNGNEIKPVEKDTNIKFVYFNENNTGSERTGVLTLTQKGTSNKITLTIKQKAKVFNCDITSFALSDSTVCQGGSLSYTYTMSNTGCTDKLYFGLVDAGGHSIESESTPSGGMGSGTFSIPSTATTGQAAVNIDTSHTYYANISSCSSRSITGTIKNDSAYVIQKATFEYYVGDELRSVNFGGGISPGSYRNVIVPISSDDAGKTWRAHKVTATTTSPEVIVDGEMNFNAYPSSTTINDNFVSFLISLQSFK